MSLLQLFDENLLEFFSAQKPAFPCCIRWRRVKKSHVSFGPTCTCVKYIFVVDFKQCVQVVYINKIMD